MSVSEFRDRSSSDAYLAWNAAHWNRGYVINIQRSLNSSDARLHRAWCNTINGAPPRGRGFVGLYIKICSESLAELRQWADLHVGAEIRPCGSWNCRPLSGSAERGAWLGSAGADVAALAMGAQPAMAGSMAVVTTKELDKLVDACQPLQIGAWVYEQHDYMTNVLLTVLDLQMLNVVVERSIRHYWDHRQANISTLEQLEELLAGFRDDKAGNTKIAQYLWGNSHWARVHWLRGFARFLADEDLRTQDALTKWAQRSEYERDFKGRVRYLGPAAYRWLVMRLGVDTVKPDVHLRRFVERVVGHSVTDTELIRVVTETAHRLGESARELDAAIWEHERGEAGGV